MRRIRVIPVLLIRDGGLVKSVKFRNHRYVGDPINAVRVFNEKEVDELVLLDIDATRQGRPPDFDKVADIASEAFMPISYGGGIATVEDAERLLAGGVEKVILNTAAFLKPDLVTQVAKRVGSQAVVASIDAGKGFFGGYRAFSHSGEKSTGEAPGALARRLVDAGAGEVLLASIDRDGTMAGYDTSLIRQIADAVDVPVIACGGAGTLDHLIDAVRCGASAVAAGSMFVFIGVHRAVLINYPSQAQLQRLYEAA